jgi:hypothetical protein
LIAAFAPDRAGVAAWLRSPSRAPIAGASLRISASRVSALFDGKEAAMEMFMVLSRLQESISRDSREVAGFWTAIVSVSLQRGGF